MILCVVPKFTSTKVIKVKTKKKGSKSEMKITVIKQQETVRSCRSQHVVETKPGQQFLPLYKTKNEFESRGKKAALNRVKCEGIPTLAEMTPSPTSGCADGLVRRRCGRSQSIKLLTLLST